MDPWVASTFWLLQNSSCTFLKGIQKETVKTSKIVSSGSDAIKNFFFVSKQVFFFCNVRCFSLLLTSIKMEFCLKREWQSSPIFLPGEFHGQRSLEDYSPRGCRESDTNEWLSFHFFIQSVEGLNSKKQGSLKKQLCDKIIASSPVWVSSLSYKFWITNLPNKWANSLREIINILLVMFLWRSLNDTGTHIKSFFIRVLTVCWELF